MHERPLSKSRYRLGLESPANRTRMMSSELSGVDGLQIEESPIMSKADEEEGSENDASMQP